MSKKDVGASKCKRTYCYDVANFLKEFGLDNNAKRLLYMSKESYCVTNDNLLGKAFEINGCQLYFQEPSKGFVIENLKWHKSDYRAKSGFREKMWN